MSASNGPLVIQSLQENLDRLKGPLGVINPQDIPMYNLSNALIGLYEDVEAEFRKLNARLTRLEQLLQR